MRVAFMDESGRAGHTEFVGMAGVDAEDGEWLEFDARWNGALAHHRAPYLHMREFAHFTGAFKGWTEDRRRALMSDCLDALHGIPIVMFAAAMRSADFYRLSQSKQEGFVDPYLICFQECLSGSAMAGYMQERGQTVHVVYSQQDEFRSLFRRLFRQWKFFSGEDGRQLGDLEFRSMTISPGLQLADLFAYEFVHYYHLKSTRPHLKPRVPFQRLCDHQLAMRGGAFKFLPYWYLDLKTCGNTGVWRAAQQIMWSDLEMWGSMLLELAPATVLDWNRLYRIRKLSQAGAVEMLRRREIKRKFGSPVPANSPLV